MTEKEKLIKEIDDFCTTYSVTPSGFGRGALNNGNFRSDLDRPEFDPKSKTIDRVRAWIKNQKKTRQRNLNRELI